MIPEILASLFFGWIMNHLLDNNRITAVAAGGVFLLIAAGLMLRVEDPGAELACVERLSLNAVPGQVS